MEPDYPLETFTTIAFYISVGAVTLTPWPDAVVLSALELASGQETGAVEAYSKSQLYWHLLTYSLRLYIVVLDC